MPTKKSVKTGTKKKPAKVPAKRRAPKERQPDFVVPEAPEPEQIVPDTSREDEIGVEMATATRELSRLQEERLLIEAKLAAHTGIFGSGFFKMRDPKNEQLLADIDVLIYEQERNYTASRRTLDALKELIAK